MVMKTKMKRTIITMVMALFASVLFIKAQTADEIVRTKYIFDKKIPSFIDIVQKHTTDTKEKVDGKSYLERLLKLNNETTAELADTYTDSIGGFHEVYKEYYKGIEVDGSKYALHYNKYGNIYRASGCFWTIETLNTTPRLSEKEALQSSMKEIGAERYAWEDARSEQFIKDISNDNKATYYPKGKLYIHIKDNVPYLTYQFNINAVQPNLHYNVLVDANNGKIIDKYSNVCEISATAIVNTNYSGNNKTIKTYNDPEEEAYILKDDTRGDYILTQKYNRENYISENNNWSTMSNYDRNALDVHWGTEKVYDFYVNKLNRQSFDSNGQYIFSLVNGTSLHNAKYVYDNSQNSHFEYGFKNNIPLVSTDIIAHEFTHGVTQFASQLVYSGESGAINEGMSDIMAVCAEHWIKPQKSDANVWKIGEDVYELRNLASPNCKYYYGNNWGCLSDTTDHGWIHNNSGVFSYWAYLLKHGGINNEISWILPITVEPIELDQIMNVCYYTNINKLSAYSNYTSLSEYTCESASELNYANFVTKQIRRAWYNVGVMSINDLMSICGPIELDNSSTFYIEDLPSGCSVKWSISDNNYNNPTYLRQDNPLFNQCSIVKSQDKSLNNATLTAEISYGGKVLAILSKKGINSKEFATDNKSSLTIKMADNQINISIKPEVDNKQEWLLEIFNATSNEKILTQNVENSFYTIDTTDWKSGIYIVRATRGDQITSEKVVIK